MRAQYAKYALELHDTELGVELLAPEQLKLVQDVAQECNRLIDERNRNNRPQLAQTQAQPRPMDYAALAELLVQLYRDPQLQQRLRDQAQQKDLLERAAQNFDKAAQAYTQIVTADADNVRKYGQARWNSISAVATAQQRCRAAQAEAENIRAQAQNLQTDGAMQLDMVFAAAAAAGRADQDTLMQLARDACNCEEERKNMRQNKKQLQ